MTLEIVVLLAAALAVFTYVQVNILHRLFLLLAERVEMLEAELTEKSEP